MRVPKNATLSESVDYVIAKPDEAPTNPDNCFRTCAKTSGFAGGVLTYSNRLQVSSVAKIVRPGKAIMVAKSTFSLTQDKPKKIAWF